MKRAKASLVSWQDKYLWDFGEKAKKVHEYFNDLYLAGSKFDGYEVFPCTYWELVKAWGRPEIRRLYEMHVFYEGSEYYD
jgi:hypothetical protein